MKNHARLVVISGLILVTVLCAGCAAPAATEEVAEAEPVEEEAITEEPTEEADEETPEPTPEEAEAQAETSACLECHTDEETLKALATEAEDDGEALSSGEG